MKLLISLGLILTSYGFSIPGTTCQESYFFRDINQPVLPLEAADKVVVLSTSRTGSTLTFMIFQYLFEDTLAYRESFDKKVVKTHDVQMCDNYCTSHPNTYIVIPIRNPLDSLISKFKTLNTLRFMPESKHFIDQMVKAHIKQHLKLWNFIEKHKQNKLFIARFEDTQTSLLSLLSSIEKEFDISVPEFEKDKMCKLFSSESISEIAKQYAHFNKQDPITGIHGHQVNKDQDSIRKYISDTHLIEIKNELKPIMELYGYE